MSEKYFYLYRVTNLINGKIYIGIHMTSNMKDCYYASGRAINQALRKYGKQNFKREILEYFSSEEEMLAREAEIVDEKFLERNDTYNLAEGGNHAGRTAAKQKKGIHSPEEREKLRIRNSQYCWVRLESESKRIPKTQLDQYLRDGWTQRNLDPTPRFCSVCGKKLSPWNKGGVYCKDCYRHSKSKISV